MDEIWTLILLSLAMLIGCYVAGMIPLAFTFSEDKLRLVTVLGAGLLVGTALAVIIPEGVHALYSGANRANHDHETHQHMAKPEGYLARKPSEVVNAPPPEIEKEIMHPDIAQHDHKLREDGDDEDHDHDGSDPHTAIGVALVLGFIFMLLVDQLGGSHIHSHSPVDQESPVAVPVQQNRHKITATLGLVVHAAADGVALGAAVNTSEAHITMIVFFAIMLHKAPAAFGLTSFLLHEGFDRPRIRKHLMMFAASAPVLALITYICLSQKNKDVLSTINATGIAMLFSAGTFLYVSTVHVLPEILGHNTHPAEGASTGQEKKGFTKIELAALVSGAIIPVLLSIGHSH